MTKIFCNRCGQSINKQPWMQAKFPILTIVCIPGVYDAAYSIDLCDKCTDDFQTWLNDHRVQPKQEETRE